MKQSTRLVAIAASAVIVLAAVTVLFVLPRLSGDADGNNGGDVVATDDNNASATPVTSSGDVVATDDNNADTTPVTSGGADSAIAVYPLAFDYADRDARDAVIGENPVEQSFFDAVNEFTYRTTAELLSSGDGNENFSPLSLYYALAVTATGTDGDTAAEMYALLGVPDAETLSAQSGNLFRRLFRDGESGTVALANSLWMDNAIAWNDAFAENAVSSFYASVFAVDFDDAQTGQRVADWIAENTNGLLTPVPQEFPPEHILTIINTVYFKSDWVSKFSEYSVAPGVFRLADGTLAECDYMSQLRRVPDYAAGDGFVRASLELKNGCSMTFILPDEGVPVRSLLSTPERVRDTLTGGEVSARTVMWSVPKFAFDSSYELNDALKSLGIATAFSDSADFSRLTDAAALISNVKQETRIGVDEFGVEAAAYTEVSISTTSIQIEEVTLELNRPFIYAIVSEDGTALFVGICENPND